MEGGVPFCRYGRQQADKASTLMHQRCIDLVVLLPHSTDLGNVYVGHAIQSRSARKASQGKEVNMKHI